MNTTHYYTLAVALVASITSVQAQVSTTNHDFLLSISEPARFDLYDRSIPKQGNNVVPVATPMQAEIDLSHPLPQLAEELTDLSALTITEHLQLATAFRLRGDFVQAVPHYARIVRLSKQPIHAFFYAQALRAAGQDLLADLYTTRYTAGIGGSLEERPLSDAERIGVAARIYGQVLSENYSNPMPNVEVRLVNICTEEELVTTTDEEGNFQFNDHPADCAFVVRFEKRFFEAVLVEAAAPGSDERVDIEMDAIQDLSFR